MDSDNLMNLHYLILFLIGAVCLSVHIDVPTALFVAMMVFGAQKMRKYESWE